MFYWVLFLVFLFDQWTKFLALRFLSETYTVPILPEIFHFTLVHNTGIAFGFFRQHPGILLVLISLSLVFLFFWASRKKDLTAGQRIAMALILGGALGNWLDRLRFGAVIDFFDFRIWPVFNVADSAISVGVAIFALLFLKSKKTE